jgi:hypothetical protein
MTITTMVFHREGRMIPSYTITSTTTPTITIIIIITITIITKINITITDHHYLPSPLATIIYHHHRHLMSSPPLAFCHHCRQRTSYTKRAKFSHLPLRGGSP